MKKYSFVPAWYMLLLFLLPLSACHKFVDWKDVWDKHKPNCRIEKIISRTDFDPTRTGIFHYNHKGDPVSVVFDYTATGASDFLFRYDHKHRIKDYLATYPNGGYQFWYSYTYGPGNRVIADTLYYFGNIVNGVPEPSVDFKFYANYEYDAHGRVASVERYSMHPVTGIAQYVYTERYTYDGDGNLSLYLQEGPAGTIIERHYGPYDNKVNMHQANKVWMFVDRNYSRNNPVAAVQYNYKGLPLKYNLADAQGHEFLWQIYLGQADIFYSCGR